MFDRSVGFMFRVMKQLLNHTSVLVLHQAGGVKNHVQHSNLSFLGIVVRFNYSKLWNPSSDNSICLY